jgi:peptidoglycan/xylan/chitin deacetylase (PgdA/CDA1 family)
MKRPLHTRSRAGARVTLAIAALVVSGAALAGVYEMAASPTPPTVRQSRPVAASPAPDAGAASGWPESAPATLPTPTPPATSAPPQAVPSERLALCGDKLASLPPDPTPALSAALRNRLVWHIPILEYHRIVPADESGGSLAGLHITPQAFAAQMGGLAAAGWHTITLEALAIDLEGGRKPPPRTFVVTIDDGYGDGYTYAFPILQAHGFVATYFVITGRIGRPANLSALEISALAAAGNEIADHTVSHIDLDLVKGAGLDHEIADAAATIEAITGQWPRTLAYPLGGHDARVVNAVAACQIMLMAVTSTEGTQETWAGRFVVPRIKIRPATSAGGLVIMLDRDFASG